MYIKLSQPEIQDNTTKAKPDLAMMLRAYELFFAGVREEEVVGFGQHYKGPSFKYVSYLAFRENLDDLVEWQANSGLPNACFLANPLHDNFNQPEEARTYKKTEPGTITSPTSTTKDFSRVCWYLLDLDRVKALKYPEGSKDYSPATPVQLTMLAEANKALMDFLDGIGFACILNHFSGNGFGLAIPVLFANNRVTERKFDSMNKIVQDCLKDFPEVEIDNGFASPRQPWSIPGSLNKKAGRQTLRKALNYDQFTPEDIVNSRDSNTICLEGHLAEAQILTASDLQPKGKLVYNEATSGLQSEMAEYLTQWDNDHCLKEMLIEHGYKLVKDFGNKAFLKRPDKEGLGHGLVVGGQKNRLWNWSSSDSTFPVGQLIKPYWAYLLLKGIAKDNRIVDQSGAKDFYREVARKYKSPFSLDRQIHLGNQVEVPRKISAPAIVEPEKPVEPIEPAKPIEPSSTAQEPRQATGTLANISMPGIIEQIAQEIMACNPRHSPSIDRAFALSLFSFMVGKSRIYKTGLFCNSYIVNLAPSSAGKECGKTFTHRFMDFIAVENEKKIKVLGLEEGACCYGYKLLDPSSTAQGLSDEALYHGRLLITGDETERYLHPDENNREGIAVRNLLLSVSNSGLIPGRALASGGTKKTAGNCFVSQIHTIQPRAYFGAFQSNLDTKGFIGRLIHFEANKGLVKHHENINPRNFSEDLIRTGLYWQAENLNGLERALPNIMDKVQNTPYMGRFQPDRLTITASKSLEDKIYEYSQYCDDKATKEYEANNGIIEKFWDKNPEHCIRLAMDFTLAEDCKALKLTLASWDLATRIMSESGLVLLRNQNKILKTKMGQLEDDIMSYLQGIWAEGRTIPFTQIWRNFRSRFGETNHKQCEDMINSLASLGMIKVNRHEDKRLSSELCKP